MKNTNLNPLLICALTGKDLADIPSNPSLTDLSGKYVSLVAKKITKITPPFESNSQFLKCKCCGKKAKYDIGHLTINIEKYQLDQQKDMEKHFQTLGYFRCKNCNVAGEWEITNEFRFLMMSALMVAVSKTDDNRFSIGENKLFDGSIHKYATDAEEHLLEKIIEANGDSFLWNRLGNLYYKGGRADLAISAFERSIVLDPMQTESHYTIGTLLSEIGEVEKAANHFHKMLLSSSNYTRMDVHSLRDLISIGLRELFYINTISNGEITIIPPLELYKELQINLQTSEASLGLLEGEVNSENIESFYPIAELYLGERSKELPTKKVYFGKKKKKKRKR
jgi:tetratricopeptide (TPR) repeat protein